ncbi:hypothetical protein [Nocardia sp. NPDC059239]|uniref:hypothetical protein n=1 Tax=Nocardia sp. NPDC059239 TaxID=3346785 RepID=UPI0036D078A9
MAIAGVTGIANPDPNYHDPHAQLPPRWDVFGKWKITNIQSASGASEFPAECVPWYQQQFPTYIKDPEFNRLNAPQNMTVPHQPVAQQFPEWIGPSNS